MGVEEFIARVGAFDPDKIVPKSVHPTIDNLEMWARPQRNESQDSLRAQVPKEIFGRQIRKPRRMAGPPFLLEYKPGVPPPGWEMASKQPTEPESPKP